MSVGSYLLSLVLLAAFVAPLVVAASALRGWLLPGWAGAPARLAEAVLALSLALVVSEALGVVGLFRVEALVAASLLVGAAALLAQRRRSAGGPAATAPAPAPLDRFENRVSLAAAVLVLAQWAVPARLSFAQGMNAPDSLWYHLPFAARFVQEGSLTDLHYVEVEPLTAFYPANAELFHAIAIALFDSHDVLSPLVNLGLVALGLLAGWCIGLAYRAPLALLGTALALALPILWGVNAGQAGNDVAGLTFLLSAVALLTLARKATEPRERSAGLALAGLAAGLALGTKFSLLAPVAVLTVAVVAVAPRAQRLRTTAIWALALFVTAGFWYVRNLVRAGSPLPTLSFDLGPISYQAAPRPLTEHLELSLAHYLFDLPVWRSHFLPGLKFGFGSVWWAVVALAAAGAIGAVLARGDRLRRALGVVALGCAVAYVVTPNSAAGREGDPWSFGLNLRYAIPAAAIALALLPAWLPERRRWRRAAAGLLAVTLAVTLLSPSNLWTGRRLEALLYVAVFGALALAATSTQLRRRPQVAWLATGALLAVAAAGFFAVQRHYLDNPYPPDTAGGAPTFAFARDLENTRIGVLGAPINYPLYGRHLSNRVVYVGRRGEHGAFTRLPTCRTWREAVNRGRFRYLVVAPVTSPDLPAEAPTAPPRELAWTASDPAATAIYRVQNLVAIFRLDGPLDPAGCA